MGTDGWPSGTAHLLLVDVRPVADLSRPIGRPCAGGSWARLADTCTADARAAEQLGLERRAQGRHCQGTWGHVGDKSPLSLCAGPGSQHGA